MSRVFDSEAALATAAGEAGRRWQAAGISSLTVGLDGPLGAGKTTWVRALLGGLGYVGRVPSPTFTLLEVYEVADLTVVHADLYRLSDPTELEFLGLRDWLETEPVWLLIEWPARGGPLLDRLDLTIRFGIRADEARVVGLDPQTQFGRVACEALIESDLNKRS